MIEEKAGIEVFVKVDPKLAAVFGNDEIVAGFAGFFVLLQTFLTFSAFKVDLFGCKPVTKPIASNTSASHASYSSGCISQPVLYS